MEETQPESTFNADAIRIVYEEAVRRAGTKSDELVQEDMWLKYIQVLLTA